MHEPLCKRLEVRSLSRLWLHVEDILTSWSEGLELSLKLYLNLGIGITNSHADMNDQGVREWKLWSSFALFIYYLFGLNLDRLVREILNLPLNFKKGKCNWHVAITLRVIRSSRTWAGVPCPGGSSYCLMLANGFQARMGNSVHQWLFFPGEFRKLDFV